MLDGVGDGEGFWLDAWVFDGVGDGLGVTEGATDGLGVGDGEVLEVLDPEADLVGTPLLQTNFLPFLMQAYSLPAALLTWPAFLHVAPALTAALEIEGLVLKVKRATNTMASDRFIRWV